MKEYKLIQEYPGSPKEGTTASTNKSKNIDYFEFSDKNYRPFQGRLPYEHVEENPKYWEKVI